MLQEFLSSEAPVLTEDSEALSAEQFAQLTAEIEELRKVIQQGQQVSLDDARKIGVWFRARRRKNFTVVREKAAKPKSETAKKPRKRKTAEEQQALADALLNSL